MPIMYSRVQTRYCRPYGAKGTHTHTHKPLNLTLTHTHRHACVHPAHTEKIIARCGSNGQFKKTYGVLITLQETLSDVCDCMCLETLGNTKQRRYTIQRAGVHYYGGNHRGLLKSFNMKQSSENWVCILHITRNCVMPFNTHEYEVLQTEHLQSGNGLKGGGVGGNKPSQINHCRDLLMR